MNSIDPNEEARIRDEQETDQIAGKTWVTYTNYEPLKEEKKSMRNSSDLAAAIAIEVNKEGIDASYGVADFDIAKTMCTLGDFLLGLQVKEEEKAKHAYQCKIKTLVNERKRLTDYNIKLEKDRDNLNEIIDEKDGIIGELETLASQLEDELVDSDVLIEDLDDRIENVIKGAQNLEKANEELERMNKNEHNKIQELQNLLANKDYHISILDEIIDERDEEIESMMTVIQNHEEEASFRKELIEEQYNLLRDTNDEIKHLDQQNSELMEDREYWKRKYYELHQYINGGQDTNKKNSIFDWPVELNLVSSRGVGSVDYNTKA